MRGLPQTCGLPLLSLRVDFYSLAKCSFCKLYHDIICALCYVILKYSLSEMPCLEQILFDFLLFFVFSKYLLFSNIPCLF